MRKTAPLRPLRSQFMRDLVRDLGTLLEADSWSTAAIQAYLRIADVDPSASSSTALDLAGWTRLSACACVLCGSAVCVVVCGMVCVVWCGVWCVAIS